MGTLAKIKNFVGAVVLTSSLFISVPAYAAIDIGAYFPLTRFSLWEILFEGDEDSHIYSVDYATIDERRVAVFLGSFFVLDEEGLKNFGNVNNGLFPEGAMIMGADAEVGSQYHTQLVTPFNFEITYDTHVVGYEDVILETGVVIKNALRLETRHYEVDLDGEFSTFERLDTYWLMEGIGIIKFHGEDYYEGNQYLYDADTLFAQVNYASNNVHYTFSATPDEANIIMYEYIDREDAWGNFIVKSILKADGSREVAERYESDIISRLTYFDPNGTMVRDVEYYEMNEGFYIKSEFVTGMQRGLGDYDCDGQITHADAAAFVAAFEDGDVSEYDLLYGDFNGDLVFDVNDVAGMQAALGEPDEDLDRLNPQEGPEGDTNGDLKVDLRDLNAVRNNFGSTGPDVEGDADGDGVVGLTDLNAVRNNFGTDLSGSPVAVVSPELASYLSAKTEKAALNVEKASYPLVSGIKSLQQQ